MPNKSLKEMQTEKLENTIKKLENKLNDPELTEKQYNAIYGIYERKKQALAEGRVY